MIITILAEPRSGSTNLTNWFYFNKNFTTLFEPENPNSKWFQNNIDPKDYKYKTKHLCIKEIYYPTLNWNSLLNVSDKIIVLYRENTQEQLESFLNAVNTDNWHLPYVYKTSENSITKEKTEYFKILKSEFKEKYLNKDYFNISYEELYYNNGFQKVLDYLNMDELENKNFPHGQKYRRNVDKRKNLI
jgi:LPS sulfotransferase NodH